jgi:hypothetical protein
VPVATLGHLELRGALDRELVRRVVHQHLNEVRYCYEQAALADHELAGRVEVQFTIEGTGLVHTAVVQSSTLHHGVAEGCITQAVRRWEFPKPQGGGVVIVSYPFVLKLAGE